MFYIILCDNIAAALKADLSGREREREGNNKNCIFYSASRYFDSGGSRQGHSTHLHLPQLFTFKSLHLQLSRARGKSFFSKKCEIFLLPLLPCLLLLLESFILLLSSSSSRLNKSD